MVSQSLQVFGAILILIYPIINMKNIKIDSYLNKKVETSIADTLAWNQCSIHSISFQTLY